MVENVTYSINAVRLHTQHTPSAVGRLLDEWIKKRGDKKLYDGEIPYGAYREKLSTLLSGYAPEARLALIPASYREERERILYTRGHLFNEHAIKDTAAVFFGRNVEARKQLEEAVKKDLETMQGTWRKIILTTKDDNDFFNALAMYFDKPNFSTVADEFYDNRGLKELGESHYDFAKRQIAYIWTKGMHPDFKAWLVKKWHLDDDPDIKNRLDKFALGAAGRGIGHAERLGSFDGKADRLAIQYFTVMLKNAFERSKMAPVDLYNNLVAEAAQIDPGLIDIKVSHGAAKSLIGKAGWPTPEQFETLCTAFKAASDAAIKPQRPWFEAIYHNTQKHPQNGKPFDKGLHAQYEIASAARERLLGENTGMGSP